ncbi:hypothetical protein [Levilactobacillus bambusae]|uniref:Uncharacterized protein n=1 Tax=Levilactobacillus bambusae TaxID=2024736 RepID=A0A2V1MYY3_9LACO|nr:hypothetical protein [Levilactobacillus bambusae]PWG00221.1 hypothetical protein DCM90_04615 [Levilactobacillus bambusae]
MTKHKKVQSVKLHLDPKTKKQASKLMAEYGMTLEDYLKMTLSASIMLNQPLGIGNADTSRLSSTQQSQVTTEKPEEDDPK